MENQTERKRKYHKTKERLLYYRVLLNKIDNLNAKLKKNKIQLKKYQIVNEGYNNRAFPNRNQDIINELLSEQAILKKRIKNLQIHSLKIKTNLEIKIDLIPDESASQVLELYYLNCLGFEDISDKLFISLTTVRRWFSKGMYLIIDQEKKDN